MAKSTVPVHLKQLIVQRYKNGETMVALGREYNILPKNIANWVHRGIKTTHTKAAAINQDTINQIVDRAFNGERPCKLAEEYDISAKKINGWICYRRNKMKVYTTGSNASGSIEEQIDTMTTDFVEKIKELTLKKVMNSLKQI